MNSPFESYDQAALFERLTGGLKNRPQNVVFLVGSPFSAPVGPQARGVPGVAGVIDLIRDEFCSDSQQTAALNKALNETSNNSYQAAFTFLLGRRGPRAVSEVVRRAVMLARLAPDVSNEYLSSDQICRYLESDVEGWDLTPAARALGQLITGYPDRFGRIVLTTNFDPLLEVSIRRSGGTYFRTNLHADGNVSNTDGIGCHIIHFHGYWYGSDTLHTPRQLGQPRPKLHDSLAALLRNALVVVCAYSGWDDCFTEALMRVVQDDSAYPEVLWAFHNPAPQIDSRLAQRLSHGIDRGRVSLYFGVDCNTFLPALIEQWYRIEPSARADAQNEGIQLNKLVLERFLDSTNADGQRLLEGDDEDRPPHVDVCVGRDDELKVLSHSDARVIFLTGIGGQGKSTVAAQYFANAQLPPAKYVLFVWRDCKEESERFENQLASIVERLSGGAVSGDDLAKQDALSIVELVMRFLRTRQVLLVFDNVDHYVDIEAKRMTRSVDLFVGAMLNHSVQSRALFTCRPSVNYGHELALSSHLEGIDLQSATELFARRGATCTPQEMSRAHDVTKGHAFWLDLLAAQVIRPGQPSTLTHLLDQVNKGRGVIPDSTLRSVWSTLQDRARIILRAMAETVRPETQLQIADYVRSTLKFNKAAKALRDLRALNLIVVKPRQHGDDLLELHPIVRHFVRQTYGHGERLPVIDEIRKVYRRMLVHFRPALASRPTLSILKHWTENAELDIQAGNITDALQTLSEVSLVFSESAYPREFIRAAELVFANVDWTDPYPAVPHFDVLFENFLDTLSYLGEHSRAITLLDAFEVRVPEKDARYIRYCGMRCHAYWMAERLEEAIHWGRIGQALKEKSDVDTKYDIAHQLALVERDAGRPEAALPVFLGGRTIEEVLNPRELDENRGGPHYGNAGRCLHLMGQMEHALVCYRKSALVIEKQMRGGHVRNQAFIRTWIGELLAAAGDYKMAAVFLSSAHAKWDQVAPPKTRGVSILEGQLAARLEGWHVDSKKAEANCLDWIHGRPNQLI